MDASTCPLKEADCAVLTSIAEKARARLQYWNKLEALGIDVTPQKAECEQQMEFCTRCKAMFFPNEL